MGAVFPPNSAPDENISAPPKIESFLDEKNLGHASGLMWRRKKYGVKSICLSKIIKSITKELNEI